MPPFPVILWRLIFKVYRSPSSSASLVMTHAALKWFHSFGLSNGPNPLDSSICHNLLEAARRDKPVSVLKRRLYLLRLLRVLLLSLLVLLLINPNDIRVACIYSLDFAGFFRYDKLSNIAPAHLELFPDHLTVFVSRAKNDIYRESNCLY